MPFENVRRRKLHYGLPFQLLHGSTWILLQIKIIVSLVFEFVGFVRLVRNWYVPLFVRFSPLATRDTEIEVRTRGGLRYIVRPKRGELSILNEVLYHDIYARQFLVNGTVVDIGAHIGVFAAYAGTKSDAVICYEPHHENYTLLLRNTQLNSLINVTSFRQAVGDTKGMRKLSVHATKSYGHTLYPYDRYNHAGTMVVETVTLEDIFSSNRLEHIDLLKVHCEGAERDILMHAPQTILEKIDKIAIKHSGRNDVELEAFLSTRGFEVRRGDREMIYAVRKRRC
ncbi:MAG: FkbM family methyltransferase [Halobacteriota archaeon]